jgi:hypothetical protein
MARSAQITFFPPMRFDRIEVYGRYIPSLDSINLILSDIDRESDRFQFIKTNNTIWLFGYIDIELRELIIKLSRNYHKQGEVVGEDATEFIKSLAVVNWFAAMAVKMKEGNMQGLKREASEVYRLFKKHDDIELDKPSSKFKFRYSDLKENFLEHAEALEICRDWYEKTVKLSNLKPELRELIICEKLLIKQIFESREKSQNFPFKNQYINICQFCKKYFTSYRGGGHKTCGSDECERRYSGATTKKNLSQPHEIAKRTKLVKAFDGVRNFCDGCGKRRVLRPLGDENLCKSCG